MQRDFTLHSFDTPIGTLTLSHELGSGSYATVWLATCPSNITYALKILSKADLSPLELEIQRLEHTLHFRVAKHANIVTIHHVHEDSENVFLVMDLWTGGDLFDALTSSPTKSISSHLRMFGQITDAIRHCHQHGVAHRDLKPENILVEESHGEFKVGVSDFGLAVDREWSTEYGCGSIRYMSPTCFSSNFPYITKANDIWSLGVILINILSSKNPWCSPTLDDVMYAEFATSPSTFFLKHFLQPYTPQIQRSLNAILQSCFRDESQRININDLSSQIQTLLLESLSSDPLVNTIPDSDGRLKQLDEMKKINRIPTPEANLSSLGISDQANREFDTNFSVVPVLEVGKRINLHAAPFSPLQHPRHEIIKTMSAWFGRILNVKDEDEMSQVERSAGDGSMELGRLRRVEFFA